jgi:hypothetical protein
VVSPFSFVRSVGSPGEPGVGSDSHPNAQACALGAPGFDGVPAFAKATARSRRSSLEILRAQAEKIGSSGEGAHGAVVALDDPKDSQASFLQRARPYVSGESRATPLAAPPDPI